MPHFPNAWRRQPTSSAAEETRQCGRAVLEVRRLAPDRVRVVVSGDVDTTNRQALGYFVERHTRASQQLVLDLSTVSFFGSQAFTALYYVSVNCARRDVDWVIVGGRDVNRILHICDPEGELPIVNNLGAAVRRLDSCARYHRTAPRLNANNDTSMAHARRGPGALADRAQRGVLAERRDLFRRHR